MTINKSLQYSKGKGKQCNCRVSQSPTPPQYVFWYHNDHMINYDTRRGGITVETVPGPRTQSRLTIRDTNDADSGNYTCSASNTEPAFIYVFVSEGKFFIFSFHKVYIKRSLTCNYSIYHHYR